MAHRNLRLVIVVHVAQKIEKTSLHSPRRFFAFAFRHLISLLPGARRNWSNAFQPTQRPLAELGKQAGRVRKCRDKGKPRVEQPSVAQLDPIAEDVAEVTDDSSSVSSEDDFEMPSDVDPVEQSVIPDSQAPFTAGQLAAIQRTVQQSIAEAMCSHHSQVVPDTVQPFPSSFPSASTGPQQRRSGVATLLGFQRALEKSTEDKILRGPPMTLLSVGAKLTSSSGL